MNQNIHTSKKESQPMVKMVSQTESQHKSKMTA